MLKNCNFINITKKVLHSNACYQAMFYNTFRAYKMAEVDEASIPDPRQKLPLKLKGKRRWR